LCAEQLVGKQLKYITDDEVHATGWFNDQGVQVIERAMDECYLVTNCDLYLEHLSEVSEGGLDEVAGGDKRASRICGVARHQVRLPPILGLRRARVSVCSGSCELECRPWTFPRSRPVRTLRTT